jgi:cholesterol transport system auxiliary component
LNSRRWWSIAILYSVLTACAGQGVPVPSDRFHRLIVGAPTTVYEMPRLAGAMEVDRFRATGVLQDRAIVFVERDRPNVLRQYDYQRWADPPTRMLQMATVDYLREARVAGQVVATGLLIDPTYTLTGEIKKLEHVVGNSSSVVIELEFGLLEHTDGSLVWVKSYATSRKVKDDTVAAATRAISEAVEEILTRLSADLARR